MKTSKLLILVSMMMALMLVVTACGTAKTEKEAVPKPDAQATAVDTKATEDPENPTPGAAGMQVKNPEDIFRFESTALYGEGGSTINPKGMLLNIGCEDCQDIFYASRSLTVEEVIEKIKTDFGIEEMIFDENFVRFDLPLDMVRRLETELDLIAAKKLSVGLEIVNIRIISIAPDKN